VPHLRRLEFLLLLFQPLRTSSLRGSGLKRLTYTVRGAAPRRSGAGRRREAKTPATVRGRYIRLVVVLLDCWA